MKKNKLYRWGAAILAAAMVLTCMPESRFYVSAEEEQGDLQEGIQENDEDILKDIREGDGNAPEDTGEDAQTETYEEGASEEPEKTVVTSAPEYMAPEPEEAQPEEAENSSAASDEAGEGDEATQADPTDPTTPTTPDPVPVTGISFDKAEMTLTRGESANLICTLEPKNADDTEVTFASLNPNVAEVVQAGTTTIDPDNATTITIETKTAGEAIITATTKNGKVASCKVTVKPIYVQEVIISPPELKMTAGETKTLEVSVFPIDAESLQNETVGEAPKAIEITSKAPGVMKVTSVYKGDGKYEVEVEALRGGRAQIVAASLVYETVQERPVASYFVDIENAENAVTALSPISDNFILYEGLSLSLANSVEYTPKTTTQRGLVWSVVDAYKDYVTVNANGRVTAKTLPADVDEMAVEVTARSEENSSATPAVFHITIKKNFSPATGIRISPSTLALEDAGSKQIDVVAVTIEPTNATDRVIKAESSDPSVAVVNKGNSANSNAVGEDTATVDVNGRAYFTVTGKKPGDCRITFSAGSEKGGVFTPRQSVTCEVTVTAYVWPVASLKLSDTSLTVTELATKDLTATIEPSTAENKNIDWTVSDPEIVAIVDDNGKAVERTLAALTQGSDGKDHLTSTVKVKGLMVGTCTITATASGGISRTCRVTVEQSASNPVTGLTIQSSIGEDTQEITLKPGMKYDLTPVIEPASADNKKVRWSSSSSGVASVETDAANGYVGIVTANRTGNCTITAQASGTTADCKKTVTVHVIDPHLEVERIDNWSYTPKDRPVTEAKLKDALDGHVFFYPVEDADPEADRTKINKEDPNYKLKIIGEGSTTELADIESEMEKPGDKTLVIYYTYDNATYRETVLVTMKAFSKANLVRVVPLTTYQSEIWNVKNGTLPANLPLPKTAEIVVVDAEPQQGGNAGGGDNKDDENTEGGDNKDDGNTEGGGDDNKDDGTTGDGGDDKGDESTGDGGDNTGDDGDNKDETTTEKDTMRVDAEIVWNLSAIDYNPGNAAAQDFKVYGEIQLPEYVLNPESISLAVEAEVHVREAVSGKKVNMPKFFVVGGEQIKNKSTVTLPAGSKISIMCETEDAEIYFLLDRRPDDGGVPKDEAHRYKTPLEMTAKTTTIYAVATKYEYDDSICSECTIKLVPADPEDPDDPDDPNDPDVPIPDDVTDEDREQIGGEVPKGLWAAVQMDADEADGFAYTGKAIKPEVHVYDYTRLLTEKKDYTISYKNNVNAGNAKGSANPPTIIVTGKGNYQGKAQVGFTIKPQDITDETVFMDEYVAEAYNGKEKKPVPALTWNGKKLVKNKDFTYLEGSYMQPGVYPIVVTGTGNYTGTRTLHYEIFRGGVAVSGLTFTKVANQKYTGSVIKPPVTVKYKNTVLVEGTEKSSVGNYWIKYENCTGPGDASLVIIGKNNYKGSKRINFKILPTAKISQAGITLNVPTAGTPYTGEAIKPECTINYNGTVLKKDTDYKIKYQNNVKAGTATVLITGKGAFTGTAKKTFKILPNDISSLAAQMEQSYPYEKGGSKPKPVVVFGEKTLTEGTDYTLTYKNNNKVGGSASVTIKGKGNYKGQIVRNFEITMQDLANLRVSAADKVYQPKANIFKTKVQVLDINGKALTPGTDYARDVTYTYADGEKAGTPVLATDVIPVGTMIRVDVRVADPKNYRGTAYGVYRIVQGDLSQAKVTVDPQQYTGKKVKPKKSQMQVTLKGVSLGKDDYEIVGYENNINQGYGKVTIRGVGSYGGTKTVKFKIGKKGLLDLIF